MKFAACCLLLGVLCVTAQPIDTDETNFRCQKSDGWKYPCGTLKPVDGFSSKKCTGPCKKEDCCQAGAGDLDHPDKCDGVNQGWDLGEPYGRESRCCYETKATSSGGQYPIGLGSQDAVDKFQQAFEKCFVMPDLEIEDPAKRFEDLEKKCKAIGSCNVCVGTNGSPFCGPKRSGSSDDRVCGHRLDDSDDIVFYGQDRCYTKEIAHEYTECEGFSGKCCGHDFKDGMTVISRNTPKNDKWQKLFEKCFSHSKGFVGLDKSFKVEAARAACAADHECQMCGTKTYPLKADKDGKLVWDTSAGPIAGGNDPFVAEFCGPRPLTAEDECSEREDEVVTYFGQNSCFSVHVESPPGPCEGVADPANNCCDRQPGFSDKFESCFDLADAKDSKDAKIACEKKGCVWCNGAAGTATAGFCGPAFDNCRFRRDNFLVHLFKGSNGNTCQFREVHRSDGRCSGLYTPPCSGDLDTAAFAECEKKRTICCDDDEKFVGGAEKCYIDPVIINAKTGEMEVVKPAALRQQCLAMDGCTPCNVNGMVTCMATPDHQCSVKVDSTTIMSFKPRNDQSRACSTSTVDPSPGRCDGVTGKCCQDGQKEWEPEMKKCSNVNLEYKQYDEDHDGATTDKDKLAARVSKWADQCEQAGCSLCMNNWSSEGQGSVPMCVPKIVHEKRPEDGDNASFMGCEERDGPAIIHYRPLASGDDKNQSVCSARPAFIANGPCDGVPVAKSPAEKDKVAPCCENYKDMSLRIQECFGQWAPNSGDGDFSEFKTACETSTRWEKPAANGKTVSTSRIGSCKIERPSIFAGGAVCVPVVTETCNVRQDQYIFTFGPNFAVKAYLDKANACYGIPDDLPCCDSLSDFAPHAAECFARVPLIAATEGDNHAAPTHLSLAEKQQKCSDKGKSTVDCNWCGGDVGYCGPKRTATAESVVCSSFTGKDACNASKTVFQASVNKQVHLCAWQDKVGGQGGICVDNPDVKTTSLSATQNRPCAQQDAGIVTTYGPTCLVGGAGAMEQKPGSNMFVIVIFLVLGAIVLLGAVKMVGGSWASTTNEKNLVLLNDYAQAP